MVIIFPACSILIIKLGRSQEQFNSFTILQLSSISPGSLNIPTNSLNLELAVI